MKFTENIIMAGTALAGLFVASTALAQTTATQEVEVVVIKGNKKGVGPTNRETGTKTKSTIGQEYISTYSAGQTIADALNLTPGYNFTNNDAYGSSGGNMILRGLDGSRISMTVDGVQLNDAGNYAIYTNQQVDSELICSATVQTGATDVDSMTGSSAGGTLNYTTCKPTDKFGIDSTVSLGSWNYTRGFFRINTGKIGPWGTKAFLTVSKQNYDTWTDETVGDGKLSKLQANLGIQQDLDNGSYFGLRAHYNMNRNRFIYSYSKSALATDWYQNSATTNGINPSNTGRISGYSKWVINDHFFFTVDPSYQYVLANGGGSQSINETNGRVSKSSHVYYYGALDANGDGDTSDTSVYIYYPNTTQTDRFSISSSGVYTFTRGDVLRFGASFDRGRTRQTGDASYLEADGYTPINVFGAKEDKSIAVLTSDGSQLERRNRFSKANVDTFFIEYNGRFLDDKLKISTGLKYQKMERELHQLCYSPVTGTGSYMPFCTNRTPDVENADGTMKFYTPRHDHSSGETDFVKPYTSTVDFSKTLPSLGATYKIGASSQIYANYSEAMSAPKTDNYYSVRRDESTGEIIVANPTPETNKTVEIGYRFANTKINLSLAAWASQYENRIVTSTDEEGNYYDRNVGKVDMNGFELAGAYAPAAKFSLFGNISYTNAEIQDDYKAGTVVIPTSGKQLVEVPDWMGNLGVNYRPLPFVGLTLYGKYVGKRYSTDVNDEYAPSYTTWNASARWDLPALRQGTYAQLNIINLTDKRYLGSISSSTTALGITGVSASAPAYYRGTPRTFQLSLHTAF